MPPSPEVLACCEEAFLFDLACEDIWARTASGSSASSLCGPAIIAEPSSSSFASYEVAQHRRVAAVEWTTLQLLLRHATRSGAAFTNGHDADNFILSRLLDSKPMTASAVVAARDQFLGKRVPTRDLVRMLARAGPLLPHAVEALKAAFSALLLIEERVAETARAENAGRAALLAAETQEWSAVLTRVHAVRQTYRYAALVEQQQATQKALCSVYARSTMTHEPSVLVQTSEKNMLDSGDGRDENVRGSVRGGQMCFLNDVVAAQLQQSRAGVALVREGLLEAARTLRSPAWCYAPLSGCVDEYVARLDARVSAAQQEVQSVQLAVCRVRLLQAGRRLRARLTGDDDVSGSASIGGEGGAGMSVQAARAPFCCGDGPPSWAAACRYLAKSVASPPLQSPGSVDRVSCTYLTASLFRSIAGLDSEAASDTLSYPAFDCFAESCSLYSGAAPVDVRWRLFASYSAAAAVAVRAGEEEEEGAGRWFTSRVMTYRHFAQFLRDLSCADADATATDSLRLSEERVAAFLMEVVVPLWVTAPVLVDLQ